jgi:circadian clock protein KaiC
MTTTPSAKNRAPPRVGAAGPQTSKLGRSRGTARNATPRIAARALPKVRTGIQGLDAVTGGGIPRGRCTLVCGGPGTGKTLLGLEFLVRGARDFGENGVLVTFEETPRDLEQNVASLGFDLEALERQGRIVIDHVVVNRADVEEAGAFDLEGLFIRIGYAVDRIGAKRILLDTVESLFSGLPDQLAVRSELRRLFGWLKERGLTAVITAEAGETTLTREGLEEYVSDCVLRLDQEVRNNVATRRLRIVKYRGSAHTGNEMPFIIDDQGFSVLPLTELRLDRAAPAGYVPSGVPGLDALLGGRGFRKGNVVLVTGTAGTGKSTIAAHFVEAACRRGERAVLFSFEESPQTLIRDMGSVGIDLGRWTSKGLLAIHAERTTSRGLEAHMATMHRIMGEFKPAVVAIDPVSGFGSQGDDWQAKNMLVLISDRMRVAGVTTLMTNLTTDGSPLESTQSGISSMADAWILLRDLESNGERNRLIHVLKARGCAHSNQVHEFHLTSHGVRIRPPYLGEAGVLTGSARLVQEANDAAQRTMIATRMADLKAQLRRTQKRLHQASGALLADHEAEHARLVRELASVRGEQRAQVARGKAMRASRGA